MALHRGWIHWLRSTRQLTVALPIQFNVGRESLDELRHHHVGQYDSRYDRVRPGNIANKIQNKLSPPGDDNDPGTDLTAGYLIRHARSHRRHVLIRIRTIVGRRRSRHWVGSFLSKRSFHPGLHQTDTIHTFDLKHEPLFTRYQIRSMLSQSDVDAQPEISPAASAIPAVSRVAELASCSFSTRSRIPLTN